MTKNLNLAVFISGNGSNLQALIDAFQNTGFPVEIKLVISHKPGAYGLKRAEKSDIPAVTIDHKKFEDRTAFEAEIENHLAEYGIDIICLAGFMRILTPGFVNRWQGRILNTHPSLLPKFGGKNMYGEHVHRAVLEAGEKESGATIFIVTPECDEGPILMQKPVPVLPDDTVQTLSARVQALEHQIYPEAVKMLAERINKSGQTA